MYGQQIQTTTSHQPILLHIFHNSLQDLESFPDNIHDKEIIFQNKGSNGK